MMHICRAEILYTPIHNILVTTEDTKIKLQEEKILTMTGDNLIQASHENYSLLELRTKLCGQI